MIYVRYRAFPSNCGAVSASRFSWDSWDNRHRPLETLKKYCLKTNRRMIIATYNTVDSIQQQAAAQMAEMFTVIGTSEPMRNPNSGNYIFSVTYKVEK